jgi:thymidylate kinase
MIDGVGPGIGKSTLAWNLAEAIAQRGLPVDILPENAIFNRPEFADAAVGFRTKQFDIEQEALPQGYEALVQRHADSGAWIIFDWSAASMAEDLPWAEDIDALTAHVRRVGEIVSGLDQIVLMLDGPIEVGVDRAIAQRGMRWFDTYAEMENSTDQRGTTRDKAIRYLARSRYARVERAFAQAEWPMVSIGATRSPENVLAVALAVLGIE